MKAGKRIISLILVIVMAALTLSSLTACKQQTTQDKNVFMIYYTNQSADDIIYKEMEIENADSMEQVVLIQTLLEIMFTQDEEDTSYYTVKPEDVTLNGIITKDGLITLDFNSAYLRMSNVREIIFRASVVLTLIQVPGIQGVAFTVDDVPITNSSGDAIGTMTKDTFVNVLLNEEGMLKQETDLTIYFANKTKDKLVPVLYRFTIDNSNFSMEEYILSRLMEGPAEGEAERTLAPNLTLISVVTTDHVCYVNFGKEFLNQEQPVSDELMIYSIVNSLCQLTYVYSVKFMVEGETNIKLHNNMDLSNPLTRDASYIETTETK